MVTPGKLSQTIGKSLLKGLALCSMCLVLILTWHKILEWKEDNKAPPRGDVSNSNQPIGGDVPLSEWNEDTPMQTELAASIESQTEIRILSESDASGNNIPKPPTKREDSNSNQPIGEDVSLSKDPTTRSKVKRILLWNDLVKKKDFGVGVGRRPFYKYGCQVNRCEIIIDNKLQDTADAVVIHTRPHSLAKDPERYPKRLRDDQVFVFFNFEAPIRTQNLQYNKFVFNLTMTYRTESDVYVPYWKLVRRKPTEPYIPRDDVIAGKTKMAVWFFSSCNKTGSVRVDYVKELANYIDIDVYGVCGNLSCPPQNHSMCMEMAERKYKFYISFENAACADYVTEKLANPLSYDIVPLAMGGLEYDKVLPEKSAIDVGRFVSPKALANYLKYLDSNPKEYIKYFKWKKDYRVERRPKDKGFCDLCKVLNNQSYVYKDQFNAYRWWNIESNCQREEALAKRYGLEYSYKKVHL